MYVCMCVFMSVCMCVFMYLCMNVFMYAWMHGWMYVWMQVCMYLWMYLCMDARMDGCMHACMNVCMYVCMYVVWMYVCMDVCMHGCMDGWMNVCMYRCMYAWMYGWMDACMHACMIYEYMNLWIYEYINIMYIYIYENLMPHCSQRAPSGGLQAARGNHSDWSSSVVPWLSSQSTCRLALTTRPAPPAPFAVLGGRYGSVHFKNHLCGPHFTSMENHGFKEGKPPHKFYEGPFLLEGLQAPHGVKEGMAFL